MAYLSNARAPMSVSMRARTEAYAGLLLLLFALTVLAFNRGEPRVSTNRFARGGASNEWPERRPIGKAVIVQGTLPEKEGTAVGNALVDGVSRHGWWVGHFADEKSARHSTAVETKWAVHQKGATHDGLVYNRQATTMAILISGKHKVILPHADVLLEYVGDYVIWGPNIAHSWTAVENSVILTVRWPSIEADQSLSGTGNNGWTSHGTNAWNRDQNETNAVPVVVGSQNVRHAMMVANVTGTGIETKDSTENASVTEKVSLTTTAMETVNIS